MAGIEHGNVTNEEFMEEAARYEYVRLTVGKKSARNLIYLVSS